MISERTLADDRRVHALDTEPPERGLVEAARRGDLDAFGLLFDRHKDAIHAFAYRSLQRREDAEDAVQETFLRAWNAIGRFRGESSLLTWLYRIAANVCAMHARSRRSRVRIADRQELDPDMLEQAESPEDVSGQTVLRQTIEAGINALPLGQRMAVDLVDIQGFACKEAAAILGCSAVAVRVRLCAAHKTLRRTLSGVLQGG